MSKEIDELKELIWEVDASASIRILRLVERLVEERDRYKKQLEEAIAESTEHIHAWQKVKPEEKP